MRNRSCKSGNAVPSLLDDELRVYMVDGRGKVSGEVTIWGETADRDCVTPSSVVVVVGEVGSLSVVLDVAFEARRYPSVLLVFSMDLRFSASLS